MPGCPVHCPKPGGTASAALAAVSLAVVTTSAAALISDVLALVLTVAAILCAAGTVALAYLLRRDGASLWLPSARERPPVRLVSSRPAQALPAPRRLAIEAPRPTLAGLEALAAEHGYDVVVRQARDD